MEALEALNLKVRGSLYSLTKEQLGDLAKFLKVEEETSEKTTLQIITAVISHRWLITVVITAVISHWWIMGYIL